MLKFRNIILILTIFTLILGLWGFQLNTIQHKMLRIQKMEQEVNSSFLQANFHKAKETLLKLAQETEDVRRKSIRYAIIKNTFQYPPLPPAETLQKRLDEATQFAEHDFKAQIIQMSSGDLEDLKKGNPAFLHFSDYEEVNIGAFRQAQAVYQTHQTEIDARRTAHLDKIRGQLNAQRAFSTPQDQTAVKRASAESEFNVLKRKANKHLANKEFKEAYEAVSAADNFLIEALTRKTITQADYLKLDAELSQFKKELFSKS